MSDSNEFLSALSDNETDDSFNTAPLAQTSSIFNLNYINTNARSLRPKITSLIDAFTNLDLTFAVVTETWFTNGSKLQSESEDLLLGHGLKALTLNRPPGNAGFSHGGVAIIHRDSLASSAIFKFPNPDAFEVLAAVLTIRGLKRKLVVISAYLPPGYTVARGKSCISYISDLILQIKDKLADPLIGLFGDFNQWKIEEAVEDYVDILETSSGPTRGDRTIDRNFCNWHQNTSTRILPPLETEETEAGTIRRSDHKIVFMQAEIEKLPPPNWQVYSYRQYSEKSAEEFQAWLESLDWTEVLSAHGSNSKARNFQLIIDEAMDYYFPCKTARRKDDDLPWFNETARKKSKKKKAVYKAEYRSPRWRAISDDLERYLGKRRDIYLEKQRSKLSNAESSRAFYKNIRNFKTHEKPPTFDVRSLRPGLSDAAVAEEAASYFNRISDEFEPLDPFEIPRTYERQLPMLSREEIEKKLISCKKPNSRVDGDLFPCLVKRCAKSLSIPLQDIYNTITITSVWPVAWKKEIVSIIPKKSIPEDFSDLRNISCTLLFSKVYEAYVLTWAMEEITLKNNQFGGVKGCSTSHMLITIWQEILDNCEDYRAATVLTAIDYAKAFNRVSYQQCLLALKRKGASS